MVLLVDAITAEFLLPAVFLFAIVVEVPILLTCIANKLFLPQYAGRQLFVSKVRGRGRRRFPG